MAIDKVQYLIDRIAVADAFAAMAYAQDDRDWDRLSTLVTNPLHLDLSNHLAHHGYTPTLALTPHEFVERAKIALSGFESTHHALSNVTATIDGDVAHGRSVITAYHYLPTGVGDKPYTTMRGSWDMELVREGDRWLFHKIRVLRTSPLDGHPGLYEIAAAEAAKKWKLEVNVESESRETTEKREEMKS